MKITKTLRPTRTAFGLQRYLDYVFLLLLASFSCSTAHAATQERPKIGGYAWSIYLIPDMDTLGTAICARDGASASVALAPYPVRVMRQDAVITCTHPNGVKAQYFMTWGVACPDSPQVYSGDYSAIPSCLAATDKPPATCPCAKAGNPIDLATKEKTQEENDYRSGLGLEFTRYYSSKKSSQAYLQGWSNNFSKRLTSIRSGAIQTLNIFPAGKQYWDGTAWRPKFDLPLAGQDAVTIGRPDGSALYFVSSNHGLTWTADSDVKFSLSTMTDGAGNFSEFQLKTPDHGLETYDQSGALASVKLPSGKVQIFSYSDAQTPSNIAPAPGLLLAVTVKARTLHFGYDSQKRMITMTDPAGQVYSYDYDTLNNLVSVTYPDGPKRVYLYNEPEFDLASGNLSLNHLLTGIVDEVSTGTLVRFATFKYDSQGLPISTEHANGVYKYAFNYVNNSITDPLGAVRTYGFQTMNGVKLTRSISQPAGAGSAAATRNISYFDNGNIYESVDVNGITTSYRYDSVRNLEITRYDAYRTPQALTTSTDWHPSYRLPLHIAEPKRLTTFTYYPNGDLQTKTIQATSDATGAQGLAAPLIGVARTWAYSYNGDGQILTVTGPRTDILDLTTYAYDPVSGDLNSVTNALGHVTTFSDFDAHGHVGTIVAPNGTTTRLTYSARGWLESQTVTDGTVSLVTTYTYDGVGHLKTATLPGQSTTYFAYDDAQRLIGIADSLGNSISYTLDAIGNKTAERITDPSGTLTRQVTRSYDALNRLQQQTGGMQ